MQDYRTITVTRTPDQFIVYNPTNYLQIGQGAQGAVFKISDNRCVKIYAKADDTALEYAAYQAVQNESMAPQIYEKGEKYMVMELLTGPSLDRYLKEKGELPLWVAEKILFVLKKMKQLKFTRIDISLRHIFKMPHHNFKIIDLVHAYLFGSSFPSMLLGDLKKMGLLEPFLKQVKALDLDLYREWKRSPRFKSI